MHDIHQTQQQPCSDAETPSNEEVRRLAQQALSRCAPFSNSDTAARLAFIGFLIIVTLYLANTSIWLVLPAIIAVGIFQYQLSVAVHEACHLGLFMPRKLNDTVGQVLAGLLGFNLQQYRRFHLNHHKLYGLPEDPEYPEYHLSDHYTGPADVIRTIMRDKTLVGAMKRFSLRITKGSAVDRQGQSASVPQTNPLYELLPTLVCQLALFTAFALTLSWQAYFIFWVLPLTIFPGLLNGARMFGEHAGLEVEGEDRLAQIYSARSTVPAPSPGLLVRLESWILGPFNFNYHHEHHLVPGASFQSLPAIHRALVDAGHYGRHKDNLSRSYYSTFQAVFSGPQE